MTAGCVIDDLPFLPDLSLPGYMLPRFILAVRLFSSAHQSVRNVVRPVIQASSDAGISDEIGNASRAVDTHITLLESFADRLLADAWRPRIKNAYASNC